QRIETIAQFVDARLRSGRQLQATHQPAEQLDPEIILQGLDLMADCGGCHVQFVGRPAKTHMPCGSFECAQRTEWRESVGHQEVQVRFCISGKYELSFIAMQHY